MNYNFDGTMVRNSSIRSMIYNAKDGNGCPDEKKRPTLSIKINYEELFSEDSILVLLFLIILISAVGMETVYSIYSLYKTPYDIVYKQCPNNLLWFYVLFSTTILKFILYVSAKGIFELHNIYNLIYFIIPDMVFTGIFGLCGYYSLQDDCITYLHNGHLYQAAIYHMYTQGIVTCIFPVPLGYFIRKKIFSKKTPTIKNDKTKKTEKDIEQANSNSGIDSDSDSDIDIESYIKIEMTNHKI